MNFTDRIALVTGAASGIGRAAVEKLAEGGASLVLVDLTEESLAPIAAELSERFGAEVLPLACDVSDETRVETVCRLAEERFGRVDILINNAGIFRCDVMPFDRQTSDMWKKKVDVNIYGTMYFCHALIGGMYERGYGRIVNIASVAGLYGIRGMVDYSMTKGAILSFTYGLAREAAEHGVAVNCVSPGNIGSKSGDGGESLSYFARRGTPEECANVICFLASDEASYVSGVNYTVDGCRKKI